MMLEPQVNLCVREPDFMGKIFFPQKLGKWAKNGPKQGFFKFIGKFGNQFLLNSIYNKNLYYLLCSCTNLIFGKNFIPQIWAKMFSASQIAEFLNQPYLQNQSMKLSDFLHVYTNSHILKVD